MKDVSRAQIYGKHVDGHWLERVEVNAIRQKESECSYTDLRYEILWVDGSLVHYFEANSIGSCLGRYRGLDIDDEGKIIKFDDSRINVDNSGGTRISYRSWNSMCSTVPHQREGKCNITAPTQDQVSEIFQSAKHIREWFHPTSVLQKE